MVRAASYDAVNEVSLVGHVSGPGERRELPSGDDVVTLRVNVPRLGQAGRVDTIDVACWGARAQRSAERLTAGDVVEVVGQLRRRFFKGGQGAASRYEVEAAALRVVQRADGSRAGRPRAREVQV